MLGSCFTQIKFDYSKSKNLPVGAAVYSDDFSAGRFLWKKVCCYPRGDVKGGFISIYLDLLSNSNSVKVIFEAFLMERDGKPSSTHARRLVKAYLIDDVGCCGWYHFVKRSDLEPLYVVDGCVTIMCGVVVIEDDCPLSVPPSDIGDHLGHLLTAGHGSDVSIVVGGKTFIAHRAVLAARSPVFMAELFGSMVEATISSITLQANIHPAAFEVLLRFIYTDVLPVDDSRFRMEMYQHLLAAADRYAMDRLKMKCANKLWDYVSVDTIAAVLSSSMTYNCLELRDKCVVLFVEDGNFKAVLFTDRYTQLVQKFPSLLAELRAKALAAQSHG